MKIKGLKKAVGVYKRANSEGPYSAWYGYLMFCANDGELWVDEFYSLGQNSWNEYHDKSIINLGDRMESEGIEVNMANVKDYILKNFPGFEA